MITKVLPAAHFGRGRGGSDTKPTIIVIHTAEVDQVEGAADAVASFFHNQPANDPNPTSAHVMVDDTTLVRMVSDLDTAYAAGPTANRWGLHLEQAGRAGWAPARWDSPYTRAQLDIAARQVAAWSRQWGIPPHRLTSADLRAGQHGICGHDDVTAAWHETTHTDPGIGYPWPQLLDRVDLYLNPPKEADMQPTLSPYTEPGHVSALWLVSADRSTRVWVLDHAEETELLAEGAVYRPLPAARMARVPVVGGYPPATAPAPAVAAP